MSRKYCKKLDNLGNTAIQCLEKIIGDDKRWIKFTGIVIKMMGASYKPRLRYADMAFDHLHDILCQEYPEQDDGIRYTEDIKNG